LRFIIFRR